LATAFFFAAVFFAGDFFTAFFAALFFLTATVYLLEYVKNPGFRRYATSLSQRGK
jgi:predicted PurR-regulated permease PerM